MGNFLVFSDYDIIAYLMVGLAMFFLLDLVLGSGFLYRHNWNTGSVTGIVLTAYIAGHLISTPASWIFENWAVKSCLMYPVVHLVPAKIRSQNPERKTDASYLCQVPIRWAALGDYFAPAPENVLKRIRAKPLAPDDASLFNEGFIAAKRDPNTYDRLLIFQRLYLLFRNIGFLTLSAFLAVLIKRGLLQFGWWRPDRHLIYYGVRPWMISFWGQLIVFFVLTVALFDRFTVFYRLYSLEVISAYAYAFTFVPGGE